MLLMLFGLIGSLVPWIPGSVFIFAGAVVHYAFLGPAKSVGVTTLVVLGLFMALALVIDLISGSIGANCFGATRWGALGGLLGSIVGMFFGLVGVFVGPVAGVLIAELLAGRGILPASRSTWGTLLGTAAGMAGKFAIGLIMVIWFLVAVLI